MPSIELWVIKTFVQTFWWCWEEGGREGQHDTSFKGSSYPLVSSLPSAHLLFIFTWHPCPDGGGGGGRVGVGDGRARGRKIRDENLIGVVGERVSYSPWFSSSPTGELWQAPPRHPPPPVISQVIHNPTSIIPFLPPFPISSCLLQECGSTWMTWSESFQLWKITRTIEIVCNQSPAEALNGGEREREREGRRGNLANFPSVADGGRNNFGMEAMYTHTHTHTVRICLLSLCNLISSFSITLLMEGMCVCVCARIYIYIYICRVFIVRRKAKPSEVIRSRELQQITFFKNSPPHTESQEFLAWKFSGMLEFIWFLKEKFIQGPPRKIRRTDSASESPHQIKCTVF